MERLIEEFIKKMDKKEFELHKPYLRTNKEKSYASDVFSDVFPLVKSVLKLTPNEQLALGIMLDFYLSSQDRSTASHFQNLKHSCMFQTESNRVQEDHL